MGLARYIFPEAAYDAVNVARAWVRFARVRAILARNAEFQNLYRDEEVFILGNGPSLNNFDLTAITGRKVITMNHFELHPHRLEFDIVAHCIGEPYGSATWEDPFPMLDGVPARLFCLNITAQQLLCQYPAYRFSYYLSGIPYSFRPHKKADMTEPMLSYQSTAQMALGLAIFMGFKRINLLGLDHDWLVTRGHSPHFYDENPEIDKADLSAFSYLEMIDISRTLFRTYAKLREMAQYAGCEVYNLSQPTYLDIFPSAPLH